MFYHIPWHVVVSLCQTRSCVSIGLRLLWGIQVGWPHQSWYREMSGQHGPQATWVWNTLPRDAWVIRYTRLRPVLVPRLETIRTAESIALKHLSKFLLQTLLTTSFCQLWVLGRSLSMSSRSIGVTTRRRSSIGGYGSQWYVQLPLEADDVSALPAASGYSDIY